MLYANRDVAPPPHRSQHTQAAIACRTACTRRVPSFDRSILDRLHVGAAAMRSASDGRCLAECSTPTGVGRPDDARAQLRLINWHASAASAPTRRAINALIACQCCCVDCDCYCDCAAVTAVVVVAASAARAPAINFNVFYFSFKASSARSSARRRPRSTGRRDGIVRDARADRRTALTRFCGLRSRALIV